MADVETKKVTRKILTQLNADDFSRLGVAAANKACELREAKDDFDRQKKAAKAKIETLTGELDTLLRTIAEGESEEEVDVEDRYIFGQNVVETWRNGVKIDERAMEPAERQTRMFKDNEDEDDEKQPSLPLDGAVAKAIEEDEKKADAGDVPPIRDQVNEEFKEASKVVRGW